MQFQCPQCKAILASDAVADGMMVTCPECGATIEVKAIIEESGGQVGDKPSLEQWLLQSGRQSARWSWKSLKGNWKSLRKFLAAEKPIETDVTRFEDIASTFEFSRLFPMAMICLFFGWVIARFATLELFDRRGCESLRIGVPSYWVIIPIAALALYGAIRAMRHFLRPKTPQWGAWIVTCLFTAIAGPLMLIVFQHIAMWAAGNSGFRPRNVLMAAVKIIGLCYYAVYSEDASIFAKFFGYIGGVGLCEEATKLLPLCLLVLNREKLPFRVDLSLRSFLVLGFFSGLGFGIGEALTCYSVTEFRIYGDQLSRWFACVPSHAVYTVIDAAFLWLFHKDIAEAKELRAKVGLFALCVVVVAVLHGIYDVLCGLPFMGLLLDAASLVLMWKIIRFAAGKRPSLDGQTYDFDDFSTSTCATFGKSFTKTYLLILFGVIIIGAVWTYGSI